MAGCHPCLPYTPVSHNYTCFTYTCFTLHYRYEALLLYSFFIVLLAMSIRNEMAIYVWYSLADSRSLATALMFSNTHDHQILILPSIFIPSTVLQETYHALSNLASEAQQIGLTQSVMLRNFHRWCLEGTFVIICV